MKCPHCKAPTIAHEGDKDGFFHCNSCGCCMNEDGEQYPGHPLCSLMANKTGKVATIVGPAPEPEENPVAAQGSAKEPAPDDEATAAPEPEKQKAHK